MTDSEKTYQMITLTSPILWRSNGSVFLDVGEKAIIKKSAMIEGVYNVIFLNPEYEITFEHDELLKFFDNRELFKFLLAD